ncbi:hypothetical protein [Cupriavidus metallidurans]|jgi:hypothetical protein|uniref:hypothetical protein n=1 Tax=Cupriavidus metallidurans TaxID=119219 RepID=UPI00046B6F26|nr:hypothetical protein [Cupriavidus metallidurans]KWR71494.1 hypothetical protein RN01_31995 [Cupriavidus sp. SHE]QWC91544.1 hypothetical protein KB891_17375 [Cupriavidus metallidurans]
MAALPVDAQAVNPPLIFRFPPNPARAADQAGPLTRPRFAGLLRACTRLQPTFTPSVTAAKPNGIEACHPAGNAWHVNGLQALRHKRKHDIGTLVALESQCQKNTSQ